MGSMLLVMWKNMEVRKLKQGGKICLKKKERKKGKSKRSEGDLGDFSLQGTMVQSRIDTKQTCGGAMHECSFKPQACPR